LLFVHYDYISCFSLYIGYSSKKLICKLSGLFVINLRKK